MPGNPCAVQCMHKMVAFAIKVGAAAIEEEGHISTKFRGNFDHCRVEWVNAPKRGKTFKRCCGIGRPTAQTSLEGDLLRQVDVVSPRLLRGRALEQVL